jgi:hypothetical protein
LGANALFNPLRRGRIGREFTATYLLAVDIDFEEDPAGTGTVIGDSRRCAGVEPALGLAV